MAERPIFVSAQGVPGLVREISFQITWQGGFAPIQKKRNVLALHKAAAAAGFQHLLEVSTKSEEKLGQRLSAFNLKVASKDHGELPLECAYQGSKIFEYGGPYTDLYDVDVRAAKRDPRLKASGKLSGFRFDGYEFPLKPATVFYNWLYVKAIFPYREWLDKRLTVYSGFTDIEFNPNKSINCQARSCALFVSLMRLNMLQDSILSPSKFIEMSECQIATSTRDEITKQDDENCCIDGTVDATICKSDIEIDQQNIHDMRQMEMVLIR